MLPPAVRKLALLGGGVVAVLLVVGLPTLGQGVTGVSGEITDAECYGHHKEAGFRSMDIFPMVIREAPAGQEFPFEMTIRNPWLHELRNVYGYVNISNAPGLSFPGEKEPVIGEPVAGTFEAAVDQPRTARFSIPVETNATELVVRLEGAPSQVEPPVNAPLRSHRNQYDLRLESPNGEIVIEGPTTLVDPLGMDTTQQPPRPTNPREPGPLSEEIRIGYDNLTAGGLGEWTATVRFRGGEQGAYRAEWGVYYNLSKATELRVFAAQALAPGDTATVRFTILADEAGATQLMRYGGIALAYHDHTDQNTEDEGNYNKWNSFEFALGSELRTQDIVVEDVGIDTLSPVFRRWAEVLGFAGSFLLIPALVLGGTFGKGSVNLFNKVFGSPRRRVLFHNSVSFWLLGVSVLHMLLLLYETHWGWSHGLVWGGLALACMIGLGVTGATQRAFVAKWGFNRWRFLHFAMGILVAVFVLIHMVADGTHLAPVREWFGPAPN